LRKYLNGFLSSQSVAQEQAPGEGFCRFFAKSAKKPEKWGQNIFTIFTHIASDAIWGALS
jgi:hypothetical protein